MKLHQLLNMPALVEQIDDGYINMQSHPTENLRIFNYSHKAQYDKMWTPETVQCRGLIVDDENNILARPWPKFFNYGEHEEGTLALDAEITARDKLDGSLGILYYAGDGYYSIATRGSFTSEQAIKGTEILRTKYQGFKPLPGITYLFEIIYPENRIVLDYGGEEKLVLLGVVDTETGETGHGDIQWPGEFADFLHARTLREALALPPRENAEGIVVRFKEDGLMLKIKQDDYVALHRIVTGLNERTVWEMLGLGASVEDICTPLPDEFKVWVEGVVDHLVAAAADIERWVRELFARIITEVSLEGNRDWTRKDFAEKANMHPDERPFLFLLLDGREEQMTCAIWKTLRPEAGRTPRTFSEDTA
jgi:RNA ligase